MVKPTSLRAVWAASLFLSAGFAPSCVFPSDTHGDDGGATSGGDSSGAGNSTGGSVSGNAGAGGGAPQGGGTTAGGGGNPQGGNSGNSEAGTTAGGGGNPPGGGGASAGGGGTPEGGGGASAGGGGTSGSFGEAGSTTSAGGGGQPGNGGSNTGGDGLGGAAGLNNGGLGGVETGGGSGGTCVGGSDANCGGMPGSAGASGNGLGGADSGGANGDPSHPLVISTQLINLPATTCGTAPTSSQTFTITNPSSVTKTWTYFLTPSAPAVSVAPPGSSLSPGQVVTVTVTPTLIPSGSLPNGTSPLVMGGLGIVEHPDNVTHMATLTLQILGIFYSWSPANLDFGVVPLHSSVTLPIAQPGDSSGRLRSNDTAFVPSNLDPGSWHRWSVTFTANAVGTHTTTLAWVSFTGRESCTQNTFTATAVVVP